MKENLNYILKLLEDEDKRTFKLILEQMKDKTDLFESLVEEYKVSSNTLVRLRLHQLLSHIFYHNLEHYFTNIPILDDGEPDLEAGAFLIARFGCPELDLVYYQGVLDQLAENIREKIKNISKPLYLLKAINDYLFKEEGFDGNQTDYMEADNSFLNLVLERRTGIPISLSVMYLLLAKRLGLPFQGINMPGHFMLKYHQQSFEMYVDPYYSGQLLTKRDCVNFMLFTGFGFKEEFLKPCTNKDILLRMVRNLYRIYQKSDASKATSLQDVMDIIQDTY